VQLGIKSRLHSDEMARDIWKILGFPGYIEIYVFFTFIAKEYFKREHLPPDLLLPIVFQTSRILLSQDNNKYEVCKDSYALKRHVSEVGLNYALS
jgi:hypothetical protein